jgi:F-type H+-transporting ATPase subunit a
MERVATVSNPIEQFEIKPLIDIDLGGYNVAFTNSSLMMVAVVVLATAFLTLSVSSRSLIPGRWQSMAELLYEFISGMLRDNVGSAGRAYFPFIFSLFVFVLFGNVLGLFPLAFTFTSHIIVTFTMAAVVFIGVTVIGFAKHGFGYFRMFFPHGVPVFVAPILVPVEIISYFSRPLSLAVRLFANMTAGHIILTVLGGFVVTLGGMYVVPGLIPFAFVSAVTLLEIGIALLQAYVFTVLSCIYLHDAIHMH